MSGTRVYLKSKRIRVPFTKVEDGSGLYRTPFLRSVFSIRLKLCFQMIEPNLVGYALDIGCGSGRALPLLSERFRHVLAIDIHDEMGKVNKFMSDGGIFNVDVIRASAEYIPIKDASFDSVACISTLDHVKHPRIALREMKRILTMNGKAVIGIHSDGIVPRIVICVIAILSKILFGKKYKSFKVDLLNPHYPSDKIEELISIVFGKSNVSSRHLTFLRPLYFVFSMTK